MLRNKAKKSRKVTSPKKYAVLEKSKRPSCDADLIDTVLTQTSAGQTMTGPSATQQMFTQAMRDYSKQKEAPANGKK